MSKNYTYIVYYRKNGIYQSIEIGREENKNKFVDAITKKGYTDIRVERKYYRGCLLVSLPY